MTSISLKGLDCLRRVMSAVLKSVELISCHGYHLDSQSNKMSQAIDVTSLNQSSLCQVVEKSDTVS